MDYKTAISQFKMSIEEQGFLRRVPIKDYYNAEIMFKLSTIQKYLNETYRIIEKSTTQALTTGTNSYPLSNVLDVKNILIDGVINQNPFTKGSRQEVENSITNGTNKGLYSFENGTLYIDGVPTTGQTLNIYYWERTYLFMPGDTGTNLSFLNYDETASGYGGSFDIPDYYSDLLIEGAVASVFPDMKQVWLMNCGLRLLNRQLNVTPKLEYHIGL